MSKKPEAVRIAEIQSRDALVREVFGYLKNPIVVALTVHVVTEYLQKKDLMGQNVGTALEIASIATPVLEKAFESGFYKDAFQSLSTVMAGFTGAVGNVAGAAGGVGSAGNMQVLPLMIPQKT